MYGKGSYFYLSRPVTRPAFYDNTYFVAKWRVWPFCSHYVMPVDPLFVNVIEKPQIREHAAVVTLKLTEQPDILAPHESEP